MEQSIELVPGEVALLAGGLDFDYGSRAGRDKTAVGLGGGVFHIVEARQRFAEVVAGAALWLCSDLGFSTTGEVIHVDAGFHMMGMVADEEG